MTIFLIAQSEGDCRVLGTFLDRRQKLHSWEDLWLAHDRKTNRRDAVIDPEGVDARSIFPSLAAQLADSAKSGPVTIVVARVRPLELNPLKQGGIEPLLAMLILAFPEVRWYFGYVDDPSNMSSGFLSRHGLCRFRDGSASELYDGYGLRNWIREIMHDPPPGYSVRPISFLASRCQCAVALDEEVAYAEFHAYAAYRHGFRAHALSTFCAANARLKGTDAAELVFEDVYASFPDCALTGVSKLYPDPSTPNTGSFRGRHDEWPVLKGARHRIIVTSGQRPRSEAAKWLHNLAYLSQQRARGVHVRLLYKPYAGIYRLWLGSGLGRKLRWQSGETGAPVRGVANDFAWPPRVREQGEDASSHSSPGVLLQIADHLTARAEDLWDELDGSGSVEEAVRGAVLATDALELLGCRTPTQSIEALRLKHKFELLAECQFSGVEHHVCIKERIAEIRRDVKAISYWFGPRKRKLAAWNAEAQILTDLVRILREHGHFDEEQYCMTNIRRAMRKIWFQDAKPFSYFAYPFRWYVEILLDRPAYFVGALTLWTTALFWFFMYHGHQKESAGGLGSEHGWEASLAETMTTFFQTQTPDGIGWLALLVSAAAILFGFVHLGIFISHLYTQVSRR